MPRTLRPSRKVRLMIDREHDDLTVGDKVRQRDGLPGIEGVQFGEIGTVVWVELQPPAGLQVRRLSVQFADHEVTMWHGEAVRVDD